MKDASDKRIRVGDVFEWRGNDAYPTIRSVVRWESRYGAFIHEWKYESGGGGSSLNAEAFSKLTVIGNVFDDASLLYPAKRSSVTRP